MYRAGIDLGGTAVKAGIIDAKQQILAQASVPTGAERPAEEVIADMAGIVRRLLDKLQIDERGLSGNRRRQSGACGCRCGHCAVL